MSSPLLPSFNNATLVASACPHLATTSGGSTTTPPAPEQGTANQNTGTLAETPSTPANNTLRKASSPPREPSLRSALRNGSPLDIPRPNLGAPLSKEADAEHPQLPTLFVDVTRSATNDVPTVQPAKRKRLPDRANTDDPNQLTNIRPEIPKPKRIRKKPQPKNVAPKPAGTADGLNVQADAIGKEDAGQKKKARKRKRAVQGSPLRRIEPKPAAIAQKAASSIQEDDTSQKNALDAHVFDQNKNLPKVKKAKTDPSMVVFKAGKPNTPSLEKETAAEETEDSEFHPSTQRMQGILPLIETHLSRLNAEVAQSQPQESTPTPFKSPVASNQADHPSYDPYPAPKNFSYDECLFAKHPREPSVQAGPCLTPPISSPSAPAPKENSLAAFNVLVDVVLQQENLPDIERKSVTFSEDTIMDEAPAPFLEKAPVAESESQPEPNKGDKVAPATAKDTSKPNSTKRQRVEKYHKNPLVRDIYTFSLDDNSDSSSSLDIPCHSARYRKFIRNPKGNEVRKKSKRKPTKSRRSKAVPVASIAPVDQTEKSTEASEVIEAPEQPAPAILAEAAQEDLASSVPEQENPRMVRSSPSLRDGLRTQRKPSQKLTEKADREEKAVEEEGERKPRARKTKEPASSTANKGKQIEETSW